MHAFGQCVYWVQKFRRITSRAQKKEIQEDSYDRWDQAQGEWYSANRIGCYRFRY